MRDSAVLLIDCPDRKGLVARVSGLLYERGANILHADQHQDHGLRLFFMRVEWGLGANASTAERFDLDGFKAAFAPVADGGTGLRDSGDCVEPPRRGEAGSVLRNSV